MDVVVRDARRLSPQAQEDLRRRAVAAVKNGMTQARMGHSSTRAALIYQHTAQQHDREIAEALSGRITRERDRARNGHGKQKQ
jgi:hypothetical protein